MQKLVLKVGRGMARLDMARNEYVSDKLRGYNEYRENW